LQLRGKILRGCNFTEGDEFGFNGDALGDLDVQQRLKRPDVAVLWNRKAQEDTQFLNAVSRRCSLPCQYREIVLRLGKTENALIRSLQRDRFLADLVDRLMRIPAISVLRFVAEEFNIANRTNYGRVE
jgi:hypothetical protein